jgi:Protein of unknown function (DUF642)
MSLTIRQLPMPQTLALFLPLVGVLLLAGVPARGANLILNGALKPALPGCQAATTNLPGWTVSAGNIDIVHATCSGIRPAYGTYFVDLTGSGARDVATISQTITTEVGQQYRLTFDFGGNPQWQDFPYPNDSSYKAMAVFVNRAIAGIYGVETAGASVTDAQWARHKNLFTATSTSTEITFESLNGSVSNPSVFGPFLDWVVVVPVATE